MIISFYLVIDHKLFEEALQASVALWDLQKYMFL